MTVSPHSTRSAVLTVAEVIDETGDAKSLVFDVPADSTERFQYKPGQIPRPCASRATGPARRRCRYSPASSPFGDEKPKVTIAHRRRLRLELDLRQRHRGRSDRGPAAIGSVHAADLDAPILPWVRERYHPGDVDSQIRSVARQRPGSPGLRQPERERCHLRRRARPADPVPRASHGWCTGCSPSRACRRWSPSPPPTAVQGLQRLHVWPGTVHGRGPQGACRRGYVQRPCTPRCSAPCPAILRGQVLQWC